MKKILTFYIIIIVAANSTGCKKDDSQVPESLNTKREHSNGIVTARFNGEMWLANISRAYYWQDQRFGIVAERYLDNYNYEGLSINDIYYSAENKAVSSLFSINEDDVNLASYNLLKDPSLTNYVIVDKYDPVTHDVSGRFELHFYKPHPEEVVPYSDTVHFTEGTFAIKINNGNK